MSYRPRIPDHIHERIEIHTLGKRMSLNNVYIGLVKMMYDDDGSYKEWSSRLDKYCERNDAEELETLTHIMTEVINEGGEPNIKYKEKLKLD